MILIILYIKLSILINLNINLRGFVETPVSLGGLGGYCSMKRVSNV